MKTIIDKKIFDFEINTYQLRYTIDKDQLVKIKNKVFKEIQRRGKHLIIFIKDDLQFIIHLGMSGIIKVIDSTNDNNIIHDHIVVTLSVNLSLFYN
ncbi:bifunctional DNA-formamidopyrimidine glycosylase/DNA-(apurinic or apyrimidinic site) lyase, partial [Francisella tularensis subsp. holarctica]|uniref:DNA-formamidopyrimidine glycosylase family protein n=1 Tax=Francisella tularensis TaxID=263 RepID=UPI0023AE04B8|nr:bifunctional DNA-formamidopyrimidine glycosylase/DNA-(apurinic or apyrimidinic site) lyase [Francisella tularensis subsp. holarctica]